MQPFRAGARDDRVKMYAWKRKAQSRRVVKAARRLARQIEKGEIIPPEIEIGDDDIDAVNDLLARLEAVDDPDAPACS